MNIRNFVNILGLFSYGLSWLGCVALFFMMCLTVVDVVARYVFNAPILGAFEITSFLVSILIFSFLGYAQSQKSHVTVDILVNVFPQKVQLVVKLINYIICFSLMGLVTWKGAAAAFEAMEAGDSPMNLPVPDHPFIFFLALGCGIMCVEFLRDILITIIKLKGEETLS